MISGVDIQKCRVCAEVHFPAHLSCAKCGAMDFETISTQQGILEQITVLNRRVGATDAEPVCIGLVRTEAGPLLIARINGNLPINTRVTLNSDGATPVATSV